MLAPPTGQSWTFVNTVTFEPFDRFSKKRYHWIHWIKTNSTFNGANFRLYRFSVIPGFIKKPLKAYSSYNFGQIFYKRFSSIATQIQQKSRQTVCPVLPLKFKFSGTGVDKL